MQELKFLKHEGEFAVLEAEDGTQFRVLVEDLTRKSKRSEPLAQSGNNPLPSPRDIQLEIRAGMGIAEIASKTGAPVDYIEKFAAPVIDELAHVVQTALSTRIAIAGDRYSETVQVEFGEVISSRLAANGFTNPTWSSRKIDNNGWQVSCQIEDATAVWSFDPKKLTLAPENELAVSLSSQQVLTDGPIPKLRAVISTQGEVRTSLPAAFEPKAQDVTVAEPTAVPVVAHPQEVETLAAQQTKADATRQTRPQSVAAAPVKPMPDESISAISVPAMQDTNELDSTLEFEDVIPFGRQGKGAVDEPESADDLANTADLLDALRRKRQQRETTTQAQHPFQPAELNTDTAVIPIVESQTGAPGLAPSPIVSTEEQAPASAQKETQVTPDDDIAATQPNPAKKGRTSVPKWDEIVFGSSKNDDN